MSQYLYNTLLSISHSFLAHLIMIYLLEHIKIDSVLSIYESEIDIVYKLPIHHMISNLADSVIPYLIHT
jgi:hypothetical protein